MYDLAIRGGTAVLGDAVVRCDIGVTGGRIAAIAEHIEEARRVIRAEGHDHQRADAARHRLHAL